MAKGYKLAFLGGGFIFFSLINSIFSGSIRDGQPFGFWSLIGFILLAVGIAKIMSYRLPLTGQNSNPSAKPAKEEQRPAQSAGQSQPPQPVLSPTPVNDPSALGTNHFESPQHPLPSVIEDETLHLPSPTPQQKIQ
jgi:hypothetical protein